MRPRVSLLRAGTRAIATAVLLPEGSDRLDAASLPVLLDPYGGRTRSWSCRPGRRTPRPSGSPIRGSQWSSPTGAAHRAGGASGAGRPPRPRRSGARGPDRRPQGCGRRASATRPVPRGHPRVELRRLPRRPGDPPSAGRVPRRHRWGSRGRLAAIRHALHGALPRHAAGRARRLRPHVARRRGRTSADGGTARASSPDPRPRRRQRGGRPHLAAVVGARRWSPAPRSRCRASPT